METTNDRNKQGFRLFVLAFITIVLGVVAVGALPGTVVAEHADQTDDRIQIVDAFNNSGNTTVAVQATTTEQVSDLQFVHDNGTNEVGPLTHSNGGINGSQYDNGSIFEPSDSFNATSGDDGVVFFELNQSWESSKIGINASAEGMTYANADRANRSVLTANAYSISLENASGGAISSQITVAVFDSSNQELHEFAGIQDGGSNFHCGGVLDGSTCTDPDTNGSAHTYLMGSSSEGVTPLPSSSAVRGINSRTSNGSTQTTLTGSHTLTLNKSVALIEYGIFDYNLSDENPLSDITRIEVRNRTSGATVQQQNSNAMGGVLLLEPKTDYEVVIEENSGETYSRSLMVPTKGITSKPILVEGNTDPATEEVFGIVRNETNSPVDNVTVTAELAGAGSIPPAYNSTTTNKNGLFSMTLPQTSDPLGKRYQFRLASSKTEGGTLKFFPTRDDSNGEGYEVRNSRTILPPLEIQQGGEVDITVTNASGGAIASNNSIASLSQTTTSTGDRTRAALVESFGTFGFGTSVNSSVIRLPSPTTGAQDDVSYNVWGLEDIDKGESPIELCAEQTDISQGTRSTSACGLENGGTLNISLTQYGSLIETNHSRTRNVGNQNYYRENILIVRNATTGNVTTYFGPKGIQQGFTPNNDREVLSVPVPAGTYTVELRPTNQFNDLTAVRNTTNVSVAKSQTKHVALESGRDFLVEPDMERTDTTLGRTTDNRVALSVYDPETEDLLTDTEVNVSIQLFHQNGTAADSKAPLDTYNSSEDTFENTTYTPDVDAGLYVVEIQVSYEDGNSTYTTTVKERLEVSDFATQIRTNQQRVNPGEAFSADIRAYDLSGDNPVPINADRKNITLTLYDRDENALATAKPPSGLSEGEGTIELPAPPDAGLYRIGILVEADDGRQGVAGTWIRVSGYDVEVNVNKSVYAPSDPVTADITVTDPSGNPVPDATLEARASTSNETASLTDATDSNGEATITLDPTALFDGNAWDGPTFVGVEATVDTGNGLARIRGGAPIRVRSFQADVSAARDQFESGENPVIDVAVPPGVDIDSVNATRINGKEIDVAGTEQSDRYYRVELDSDLTTYGVQSDGAFSVQVEVTDGSGRTATDRTRFAVSSLNVRAEADSFTYDTSENVTVRAEVRHPNGSRAVGESVTMELYERGSPPIRADKNESLDPTGADGRTTGELSPDDSGIHTVVVRAGGNRHVFPVLVSDIETVFRDSSGSPVESYEFTPGDTGAKINISAENTSAENNSGGINGDMRVRAFIDGNLEVLGESEITDGTGNVSFSIPESASTGTYPVEVIVRSETRAFARNTTTIELTPDSETVSLETDARETVYAPGDNIRIGAEVTDGNGPIDEQVEFALVSPSTEEILNTSKTGSDGTVTVEELLPTDITNGEYGIRARLPNGKTAYDGILVSDMELSLDTNQSAYAAGNNVTVNLTATADGTPVSDAEGGVRVRLSDGSTVRKSFNGTGESSPYEVEIGLPDDDAAIGTRTVEAFVRNGSSVATASTSIDVYNASESATLSVPDTIIANGTDFTVGANATVDTNATLNVFSPGTASVAYREDLSLNESTSLSLSDPGTYVFELTVPGVETRTVVRNVDSGPDDPSVYVGPSNSENATEFDTNEPIHIRTDGDDMTAEVFTPGDSFTISLNQDGGEGSYGVLSSSDTSAGPYLIRLDGANSTDVDSVLVEVSN